MKMKSDRQPPPLLNPCQRRPKNRLKDIMPVFEKNIVDLVQDTESMQQVFLAIQGDPSPALSRVLSYLPIFED